MTVLGIGPLLFIAGGVPLAGILVLQYMSDVAISFPSPWMQIFLVLGIALCAIGACFWFPSALMVEKAFRHHRLVTSGVFSVSRNPLYAAFICFIIPGVAFILNNLLILAAALLMFLAFKLLIGKEEEYLREEFGEDYLDYEREVAQLIPFVKI